MFSLLFKSFYHSQDVLLETLTIFCRLWILTCGINVFHILDGCTLRTRERLVSKETTCILISPFFFLLDYKGYSASNPALSCAEVLENRP